MSLAQAVASLSGPAVKARRWICASHGSRQPACKAEGDPGPVSPDKVPHRFEFIKGVFHSRIIADFETHSESP